MPDRDAASAAEAMQNALARPGDARTFGTLLDADKMTSAVSEGTDTGKIALEMRRIVLEEDSLRLDGLYDRLRNPLDRDGEPEALSDKQKQTILLEMMALYLCSMVRGVGLLVDCLSIRAVTKQETKTGYKRVSLANIADETAEAVDSLTSHPELKDKNGKVKEEASVGEIGGWMQFHDQRLQERLQIIQGMLYIGALNVMPDIFHGPILDENGVPRRDEKGSPMIADDLFAGDRATVSTTGGPKRRLGEIKQERETAEAEVVSEDVVAERRKKLQREMEKDRERAGGK